MSRRRLAIFGALAAAVIAVVVWLATGSSSTPATGGGGGSASSARTGSGRAPTRPTGGGLIQPGVDARHVAGHVTFEGRAVAGATVTLASALTASGLAVAPTVTTGDDGAFDLGPQGAAPITVAASAPGKAGAVLPIDLRDPTLRPPADALELVLHACTASVFGAVVDAGGGPIAGAQVRRGPIATIAADDGAFDVCVPVGQAELMISADGYGTIKSSLAVYGRLHHDFRLSPEGVITGRTVGDDGNPVAGAVVSLSATDDPMLGPVWDSRGAPAQTVSDGDGRFRIAGVLPGRRQLTAAADGLRTASAIDVAVEAGETGDEVVLTLSAAVAVRGIVVDEAHKPVAGVEVSIASQDTPWADTSANAVSQTDGRFAVDAVVPGAYTMYVRSYRFADNQRVHPLTVPAAGVTDLEIVVARGSSVSGIVTRKGHAVEGAEVSFRDGGFARSGADGAFTLRGIAPGEHELYAQSDQDGAFTHGPEVTVTAGADVTGVAVELDLAGSIAGRVVDQHGAPVPGVYLAFSLVGGRDFGRSTTADDGTFLVQALSGGGDYGVRITASAGGSMVFKPATGDDFPSVTVADGGSQVTGISYAIRVDRLVIAGRVVDDNGTPLPDVRVDARPGSGGRSFSEPVTDVTDGDGAFTITNLLAGPYQVAARSGSGAEARVDHDVDAGTRGLTITLSAPGAIEGTLAGFTGPVRVVARFAPSTLGPRSDPSRMIRTFTAQVVGTTFRLRGLAAGAYTVDANVGGVVADSAQVDVASGQTASATLTFRGLGKITGVVTSAATNAPVEGAHCFTPKAGRTSDYLTDAQGHFAIDPAPVGVNFVVCRDSERNQGRAEVTVAANAETTTAISLTKMEPPKPRGTIGATFTRTAQGPKVTAVVDGGPAAKAGVKVGDVLTAIDQFGDIPLAELDNDFVAMAIGSLGVGTTIKLTLKRGTETVTISVTIAAP